MPFIHCRDCDYWRDGPTGELMPSTKQLGYCFRHPLPPGADDHQQSLHNCGCGDGDWRICDVHNAYGHCSQCSDLEDQKLEL